MAKRRRKPRFDSGAEVRKLARERVGIVKPTKPIEEKPLRRKPKYKKSPLEETD